MSMSLWNLIIAGAGAVAGASPAPPATVLPEVADAMIWTPMAVAAAALFLDLYNSNAIRTEGALDGALEGLL